MRRHTRCVSAGQLIPPQGLREVRGLGHHHWGVRQKRNPKQNPCWGGAAAIELLLSASCHVSLVVTASTACFRLRQASRRAFVLPSPPLTLDTISASSSGSSSV